MKSPVNPNPSTAQAFGPTIFSLTSLGLRPNLYLGCKLTGGDPARLDAIKQIIDQLNEGTFNVLPFAFNFGTKQPLGDPDNVLFHGLSKVEIATVMVVVIDGDASDGRGMEIAHRAHQGEAKVALTLILAAEDKPLSPMYLGFDDLFGTTTLRFKNLEDIPGIVEEWYGSASQFTVDADLLPISTNIQVA